MIKSNFIKTYLQPNYETVYLDVTTNENVLKCDISDVNIDIITSKVFKINQEKEIQKLKLFLTDKISPDTIEEVFQWLLREFNVEIPY